MSTNVLAAIFPDRDTAVATRDALGDEHYRSRWLAVTKPADHLEHEPSSDARPDLHEVTETSDGALGAVGRFLSGAGDSLRKALEDHGVSEADAQAIDAALPPSGAILVVHTPPERSGEAARTLREGGGRLYPTDDARPDVDETPVAAGSLASSTLGDERIGVANIGDAAGATMSVGRSPEEEALAGGPALDAAPEKFVVRKRIVTEMVSIEVPVEREEIFLERR